MIPTMIPAKTPPASLAADLALFFASTRGKTKVRSAKSVAMIIWSMVVAGRRGRGGGGGKGVLWSDRRVVTYKRCGHVPGTFHLNSNCPPCSPHHPILANQLVPRACCPLALLIDNVKSNSGPDWPCLAGLQLADPHMCDVGQK